MEGKVLKVEQASSKQGAVVDPRLFGTNILMDRDFLGESDRGSPNGDSRFSMAFSDLNATGLRYPGGAIAEMYLNLADPNNPVAWDQLGLSATAGQLRPIVTLNEMFMFAAEQNVSVTVVVPTYRFLGDVKDSNGHRIADVDRALVESFIQQCLSAAELLGTKIDAFEIGNEWWIDNASLLGTRMTPVEYARIASQLAVIVDQVVAGSSLGILSEEPKVLIQVGPGGNAERFTPTGHFIADNHSGATVSATSLIFREFDQAAEREAVDGLITHRYLTGSDTMITGWPYQPFEEFSRLAASVVGFGDLEYHVTEWNVAARNTAELGIQQAGNILSMFVELLETGVDAASVWAVQQNNGSSLATSSGLAGSEYRGLTAAGTVFSLLAEKVQGLRYIPTVQSLSSIESYLFSGPEASYLYLFNDSPFGDHVSIAPIEIIQEYHIAKVDIVSSVNGIRSQSKIIPELTSPGHESVRDENGDVELTLSAYDVVQLTILYPTVSTFTTSRRWNDVWSGEGVHDIIVAGAGQSLVKGADGNDTIYGGGGADELWGGDGNDFLLGQHDNDWINGVNGDDLIYGGDGNDIIWGGAGNDTVYGGSGTDQINTGRGMDLVLGGAGGDTVHLGWGNDIVTGGDGADTFIFVPHSGRSVITDYEVGEKLIVGQVLEQQSAIVLIDAVVNSDAVQLSFSNGARLTVNGATYADLAAWDIL